ncbi:hypothetical protein BCR36DRAFT_459391 [Piromyces finnis]|uniref:EGF-like domain-containing protein n=1 Tax=Piromyces finnis TaxID=1754191 RepID=A0A1Y1VJY9_9FUNG|nr:hypothetical protein BCR36DRAFT_459391 [Piromyces finnis]|eukprot:ORX57678.1 hypothetical protein BCR36DRAFT_459391 [Piromyces finnis]
MIFNQASSITLDNCYFSKLGKAIAFNYDVVLYTSINTNNHLKISNSVFEDINIESKTPMINSDGLVLEIYNTTYRNCHSNAGYLFNIMNHNEKGYITIDNSIFQDTATLIHGNSINCNILNSQFNNIEIKNSMPAISDSKYSKFTISDTKFYNLNINHALFGEESIYKLNNIKLSKIKTNSKSLFHFIYNNIEISNIEAENISCLGESGNTSFILYDSGETKNYLSIKNLHICNSTTNGPLIKVIGDQSKVNIENSEIHDISSFGSIIELLNEKNEIMMNDLKFYNNINNDKLSCGNIHFINKLNLTIKNSKFFNNFCKSNGGAICIENISKIDLELNHNEFFNNKAMNGGALYLTNGSNLKENETMNITIQNNIFQKNIANDFGGAIYSNFSKLYLASTKNNSIIYNEAGIMGGGLYSPKSANKNLFNLNDFVIENNTVNSFIDNYTTKPSYIKLENEFSNNFVNITTGSYLHLLFKLYDEYDNIIEDPTKNYSSMILKIILKEKYNNTSEGTPYSLSENIGTFIYGKCEFNNFRIFSKPNTYTMKLMIENYNDDIMFKNSELEIKVNSCNENQIKMYNKKGILYCETPKCKPECPVGITASCIPDSNNENINNPNKNICSCYSGWEGQYCQNKKFIDFNKIKNSITTINIAILSILLVYIIFIVHYKDIIIIKDEGCNKILLFSIGICLFFISIFFIPQLNYTECLLNFVTKHIGISFLLIIQYIYVSLGLELGISNKKLSKDNIVSTFKSNDGIPSMNSDISISVNSPSSIFTPKQQETNKIINQKTSDNYSTSYSIKSNKYAITSNQETTINENNKRMSIIESQYSNNCENIVNSNGMCETINYGNDASNNNEMCETINYGNYASNNNEMCETINYGYVTSNNNSDFDKNRQNKDHQNSLQINTKNINKNKLSISHININDTPKNNENPNALSKNKNYKAIKKSIKRAHSIFIDICIIYPIFILITLLVSVLIIVDERKREDLKINTIQNKNGEWTYKCNINNINIIYHFLEMSILLVILCKGVIIFKYECIFRCTRSITYSSLTSVILGPAINIFSILFLDNQQYEKTVLELMLNSICYIICFILFSWNIIFYIIKNGNKTNYKDYFVYVDHDEKLCKNAFICSYEIIDDFKEKNNPIIKDYINFYKICSRTFEISGRKLKYIDVKSKIKIIKETFKSNSK